MPKNPRYLRNRAIAAALALFMALGPALSVRAYASEGENPGGAAEGQESQAAQEAVAGSAAHKYVITNKSDDPAYWHDQDCRQDIDGRSVAPGDPEWPAEVFGTGLDEEHGLLGHHDGRCYKTYIDDPTLERPEHDHEQDEPDGDEASVPPAVDSGFEHGEDCVQIGHLACGDTSPGHEHGEDCYENGWVDENHWEHDDTCIKAPYKPSFINSTTLLTSDDADGLSMTVTASKPQVHVNESFEYVIEINDAKHTSNPAITLTVPLVDGITFTGCNASLSVENGVAKITRVVVSEWPVKVIVSAKATKPGMFTVSANLHNYYVGVENNDIPGEATVTAYAPYRLVYDANGGHIRKDSSSASSMTHEASWFENAYTFTVKTAPEGSTGFDPTWAGHTLLGWADTPDATVPVYKPGDEIIVSKDEPLRTIYAVWASYPDLPATGGEGDGFILAVGIAGCLAGFATLALLRKRELD